MKAAVWIDRVKSSKGWESDYRTAKELGCKPHTISMYRSNETLMDETIALKVALALGVEPIVILADQAMERAKSEPAKKAWKEVLEKLGASQLYIMLSSLAEKSKKPSQAIPHPLQVMMNAFVQA